MFMYVWIDGCLQVDLPICIVLNRSLNLIPIPSILKTPQPPPLNISLEAVKKGAHSQTHTHTNNDNNKSK